MMDPEERQQQLIIQEDEDILDMLMDELVDSDSEEEIKWGGSRAGKAPNKKRDFVQAHADGWQPFPPVRCAHDSGVATNSGQDL